MFKHGFYRHLDARRALLMATPFCAIFAAQSAHAIDHNPTNLATLRTALNTVNASATNDRIFLPAGTITLDAGRLDNANVSGDLDITKAIGTLEIIGAGQTTTILDGNGLDRVFHINAASSVDISNLTIRNGLATDNGSATGTALGGGILHTGTGVLTLLNVTITQNEAQGQAGANGAVAGGNGSSGSPADGGGLYLAGGGVAISACTISNNTASGGQGGDGAAGANVTGGSIANGNNGGSGGSGAQARGGGLYCAAAGTIAINGSTISGNVAAAGSGGNGGRGGDALANGVTPVIAANGGNGGNGGNGIQASGGGLYVSSGTISLSECCVSGNSATGGAGGTGGQGGDGSAAGSAVTSSGAGGSGGNGGGSGLGGGGGFFLANGSLTIVNTTVSGNTASSGDGGGGGMGGDGLGTMTSPGSGGDGGQAQFAAGGGISASAGTLDISNTTLAFNTAVSGNVGQGGGPGPGGTAASSGANGSSLGGGIGGGIANFGATLTIDSSIVSDNAADSSLDIQGTVTADACVIEVLAGASITAGPNGNLSGDPGLSALAFNGGPTRNHRIASNSIARNTGTNPLSRPTDQRGQPRNDGNGVDVGAFEYTASIDGSGSGGGGDGDGGGCSTDTTTGRYWLLAPLLGLIAIFRRRRLRE
ncbi:MAG: hypothetical protein H6839_16385 [Planctomycetes bacterium]|nr:hypothetical protein [Planctomycetota bacterium]